LDLVPKSTTKSMSIMNSMLLSSYIIICSHVKWHDHNSLIENARVSSFKKETSYNRNITSSPLLNRYINHTNFQYQCTYITHQVIHHSKVINCEYLSIALCHVDFLLQEDFTFHVINPSTFLNIVTSWPFRKTRINLTEEVYFY